MSINSKINKFIEIYSKLMTKAILNYKDNTLSLMKELQTRKK